MQHKLALLVLFLLSPLLQGCEKKEMAEESYLSVISLTLNGASFSDGIEDVPLDLELSVTFSAALDPGLFRSAISLHSAAREVPLNISFSNALSKATITAQLSYATDYTLHISKDIIGANSRKLEKALNVSFTTAEDEVIRTMPPCTAAGDCLDSRNLGTSSEPALFSYYSSYPLYMEKARWENLKYAIIVVHGQERNADDYFSYLSSTLMLQKLADSTLLIAPWFKAQANAGSSELYWGTNGWREGQPSGNTVKISSFATADSLVKQLSNKERFPALRRIIVTGHSSGGLFTHLYGASNSSVEQYPALDFRYVVANSQYFYYPSDYRYNEQSGEFYIPADCFGFNYWPQGYQNAPSYLNGASAEALNSQFTARNITYLLGNGSGSDRSLNTVDCKANLLGSSRYQRGENMYRYMNESYADQHSHSKVIVNGVGHDGEGMYKSAEFITLMLQLFGEK